MRSDRSDLSASVFLIVTNAMTAYVSDMAIKNKNGMIVEV